MQGVSLEVILLLLLEMVGLEAAVPRASWLPAPELSFAGSRGRENEIPPWREGLGPQTEASRLCIINHRSRGTPLSSLPSWPVLQNLGEAEDAKGAFWALSVDYLPANKEPTALQIHLLGVLP